MKRTVFFICCTLLFASISCKQKPTSVEEKMNANKDTITFFPVAEYIKQQINHIDSTPYFLYCIHVAEGRKDSTTIDKKVFDSLATIFTRYNISDSLVKKKYSETIFNDLSTQSYTLSYRTSDTTLPLQSVDVLLNPDNQQVKRIFWTIQNNKAGKTIIEKVGWKANHRFYINRTILLSDGKELTEQNTVVWNDKD